MRQRNSTTRKSPLSTKPGIPKPTKNVANFIFHPCSNTFSTIEAPTFRAKLPSRRFWFISGVINPQKMLLISYMKISNIFSTIVSIRPRSASHKPSRHPTKPLRLSVPLRLLLYPLLSCRIFRGVRRAVRILRRYPSVRPSSP